MGVRELALDAYGEKQRARLSAEQQEEKERQRREAERYEQGKQTIQASALGSWFPGEDWDIMDFAGKGTAIGAYQSDGREVVVAPQDRSIRLLLQYDRATDGSTWAPPRVFFVRTHTDTATGYGYWDGPEVRSLADIGECIARQEGVST